MNNKVKEECVHSNCTKPVHGYLLTKFTDNYKKPEKFGLCNAHLSEWDNADWLGIERIDRQLEMDYMEEMHRREGHI